MTAAITDFSHFTDLRMAADRNDPAALREVAGQFEALFLQTMLKNMREASLGDSLLGNSDQHDMYQGMMDQQLALEMSSGKGIGLADMLVRQLGGEEAETSSPPSGPFPVSRRNVSNVSSPEPRWSDPSEFARDIWPHAERVAKQLNVATEAIVAQAALETGWGAHVMPDKNGDNSLNLFGIKAGADWQGQQVTRSTLEFEAGIPRPENARFRAYENVAATFKDYAEFLTNNPRYSGVRDHGADVDGFASSLQDSGYATDPNYAEKITSILNSPTMRGLMAERQPTLNESTAQPITARLSARAQ